MVPRFEEVVARKSGAAYGVAVNSATSALHVACKALDLKHGDRLWTSPNSFVASANCGRYCGAKIDFVDIDPDTYNMSVGALTEKLERAERGGTLPEVIIPVHFAGQSCDMRAIGDLAQKYGFRVVEDASHAIGALYEDEPVGNCKYSDITVFSFHPVKIITTAEGGLATTNDEELAAKMARLRSHGITRAPIELSRTTEGPWYYEQIELGFNYRMTDLQAALGISQLRRLDEFVAARHRLADRYDEELSSLPLKLPTRSPDARSALHLYPIQLQQNRKEIFTALRDAEIGVSVHYIPIHLQPDYARYGFKEGDFPEAEAYYKGAISLPMFSSLRDQDQDYVISRLKLALEL